MWGCALTLHAEVSISNEHGLPIPEATGNHAIGASTAAWGLGHSYPGPGDEHVYLLWEWEDCCLPVI